MRRLRGPPDSDQDPLAKLEYGPSDPVTDICEKVPDKAYLEKVPDKAYQSSVSFCNVLEPSKASARRCLAPSDPTCS
jgi:hypothetical protein